MVVLSAAWKCLFFSTLRKDFLKILLKILCRSPDKVHFGNNLHEVSKKSFHTCKRAIFWRHKRKSDSQQKTIARKKTCTSTCNELPSFTQKSCFSNSLDQLMLAPTIVKVSLSRAIYLGLSVHDLTYCTQKTKCTVHREVLIMQWKLMQ